MADVVKDALSLLEKDKSVWSETYRKAREDLEFQSDDQFAQWDAEDFDARAGTGRPALTIDQLSQFVHQVENDIRMNTPSIEVIPADNQANAETSEIFRGLIKAIEYHSQADDAYDLASSFAVRCGIGFLRVDHDYVSETEGFEQELRIKRVTNPLSVYIDGDTREAGGVDIKHAFLPEDLSQAEFKRRWPKADMVSFEYADDDYGREVQGEESIRICEFFQIDEEETDYTEGDKTRKVKKRTVRRYILSGKEVLEETVFPGKYIPIVPVYGEETFVNGKRELFSLIRRSKDAQRMFNYWKSLETELLMKAPNAPILAVEGTTEDFKDDWLNPQKSMVLRYKQQDSKGNPASPPQRLEPPTIPTGIVNAARATVDDIKATMGLYGSSIGQRTNETSGIAIQRRQQEGDVATYHFGDNLVKAITQIGRIIVCAIPEVYDTPRVLKIIGEEEEIKDVGVNGEVYEDQEEEYDLTKGVYGIRVTTGAPFTTKRQQAADFYSQVATSQPQLMEIMGDLLFKNMDITGAESMAARMKKIIPKELLDEEDGEEAVDPEKMQMGQLIEQGQMALQEMQGQMGQLQAQLNDKQTEYALKAKELEIKQNDVQVKAQDNQSDAMQEQQKLELEAYKAQQEVEYKNKELELEMMKLQVEAQQPAEVPQDNSNAEFAQIIADSLAQVAQMNAQGDQAVIEALSAPKQVVRDEQGNISGVVSGGQ